MCNTHASQSLAVIRVDRHSSIDAAADDTLVTRSPINHKKFINSSVIREFSAHLCKHISRRAFFQRSVSSYNCYCYSNDPYSKRKHETLIHSASENPHLFLLFSLFSICVSVRLLFSFRLHFNVVVSLHFCAVYCVVESLTCKDKHLTDFDGPMHSCACTRPLQQLPKGKQKAFENKIESYVRV